jgi:hypothetical protein
MTACNHQPPPPGHCCGCGWEFQRGRVYRCQSCGGDLCLVCEIKQPDFGELSRAAASPPAASPAEQTKEVQ